MTQNKRPWIARLEKRWNVSGPRVIIILIVFACTGFSVMFLKKPIVGIFTENGEQNVVFSIIYYILILPIYNLLLLVWGFVFGQFKFFWEFEKKFFKRLLRIKN